MADEQLHEKIIETARRLADDSPTDDVSGEELASELGLDAGDPTLREALKAGADRGDLACQGWHDENSLPTRIRAGAQPGATSRD